MAKPESLVAEIENLSVKLAEARASLGKRIIGQDRVIDLSMAALLCGGHGLLIGLPGLGKTRLVTTLATVMGLDRRVPLKATTMSSPDIRAGVSLLLAAMSAEGTSTIHNIEQIDRGYQDIEHRLNAIGARITRL